MGLEPTRCPLGHQLEPEPMRTTEFAPALPPAKEQSAPASGYAPAEVALPFKQGRFSGRDFALQPDGTLHCPAGQALCATEERREVDSRLRLVYAARISQCRGCPLREQCQWHGGNTQKPRRVSVLLHPLQVGSAPLRLRRIGVADSIVEPVCNSCVTNGLTCTWSLPTSMVQPRLPLCFLVRSAAHARLSWEERLACNASASTTARSTITLFGIPEGFAASLGLFTT
jgi:hypothetical protein